MCLDLNLYQQKQFSVWHNGARLYSENYDLGQILGVTEVRAGDTVEVRVTCKANQTGTSLSIKAAILNEEVFRKGYEILNASTLQMTDFSGTYIAGTIDCNRDGLLYTSIPQNGNWVAFVDGQPAEITLVGDCMVGLMLTEGQHSIAFRYENQALRWGSLITGGCGLIFAAVIVTDLLHRKKKAK